MVTDSPQPGEPFNHKGQYAILDVVERMPISSTCKRIYRKLFTYKNEAFPRHHTVAEDLNISTTTARRCVVLLEKAGLVRRCARYREDGGQTSNQVEILFHEAFRSVYKHKNEHPPVHSGTPHISSPQLVGKTSKTDLDPQPQVAMNPAFALVAQKAQTVLQKPVSVESGALLIEAGLGSVQRVMSVLDRLTTAKEPIETVSGLRSCIIGSNIDAYERIGLFRPEMVMPVVKVPMQAAHVPDFLGMDADEAVAA